MSQGSSTLTGQGSRYPVGVLSWPVGVIPWPIGILTWPVRVLLAQPVSLMGWVTGYGPRASSNHYCLVSSSTGGANFLQKKTNRHNFSPRSSDWELVG